MVLFDESTLTPIDGVGEGDGRFYEADLGFIATYEMLSPEVTERRVVREYPNGGKDVETFVVSPEVGKWAVETDGGIDVSGLVEVPSWAEKSQSPVRFSDTVMVFHQWTPGEAEEHAANEERRELLDDMLQSGFVDGTDEALCELYELSLAQQEVMDEQDAAICALYEMMEV